MRPQGSLGRLGRALAEEQDRQLEQVDPAEKARARLFGETPRLAARKRARFLAAGAALAAAALVVLLWRGRSGALSFHVDGNEGRTDDWLASGASAMPVQFSDGTRIDLEPTTRARVTELRSEGARVVLERGRAQVAVVHRPGARWFVDAGPFVVQVTGTRFSVEWDASGEIFRLTMTEGSVVVGGACLPTPRSFKAGDTAVLSCGAAKGNPAASTALQTPAPVPTTTGSPGLLEVPPVPELPDGRPSASGALSAPLTPATSPTPTTPPEPAGSPTSATPSEPATSPPGVARGPREVPASTGAGTPPSGRVGVPSEGGPAGSSGPPSEPPVAPGWRALAAGRRYREAMADAEHQGFDGLCTSLAAAELSSLGDVARFSGNAGRAHQALTSLRRRFPGDAHAAVAAFTLGRIAFDQQGSPAEAASWFSSYLAEQPEGAFAQEALGRLMEARQRSGDGVGARHAAQQYTGRFPGGAHEALARRLLGTSGAP